MYFHLGQMAKNEKYGITEKQIKPKQEEDDSWIIVKNSKNGSKASEVKRRVRTTKGQYPKR